MVDINDIDKIHKKPNIFIGVKKKKKKRKI